MDLDFELGDPQAPRGHAIAYFRSAQNPESLVATYLVVPPVLMDLAKYLPPMFASQLGARELQSVSAIPLPPIPETVESYAWLRRLAEVRGDDLVNLGTVGAGDVERLIIATTEAAQRYQRLYLNHVERLPATETAETLERASGGQFDADEILYQLLGERELLGELAKLAGTLRYAVEGNDTRLQRETVATMKTAVKHLPGKYQGEKIIAVAQAPGDYGNRLTQLYLDRGFKLAAEDYEALRPIEQQIREIEKPA